MKIKVFAVIDTNVLISALYSQSGYPFEIFKLIEEGNIIPIFDERILKEYSDVFRYEKFLNIFNEKTQELAINTIKENGILINNVEKTKVQLKDQSDIPFFEVKESSEEFDSKLITGNKKHFPEQSDILTPKETIACMEYMDRFIKFDIDYDETIKKIIEDNVQTPKYDLGEILRD